MSYPPLLERFTSKRTETVGKRFDTPLAQRVEERRAALLRGPDTKEADPTVAALARLERTDRMRAFLAATQTLPPAAFVVTGPHRSAH